MYEFGNWLTRLARGGVVLAPAEKWLLRQLVNNLPPHLKPIVEDQIASYNLAQREWDKRAVNFYRRPTLLPGMSLLDMPPMEALPLVRVTASVANDDPIHATLTAVSGRVFCMAFSRPAKGVLVADMKITRVEDAWRSNFPADAPNNSFKPNPLRGSACFRR